MAAVHCLYWFKHDIVCRAVQDRFQWLTEKQKKDANGKRPNDKVRWLLSLAFGKS